MKCKTNSIIIIDEERCKGCGYCVLVCRDKNLFFSKKLNRHGYHPVQKKEDACSGCGLCYIVCPDVAITVRKKP